MSLMLEIDTSTFMVYTSKDSIWAHHVGNGREYQLHHIANQHPQAVKKAVSELHQQKQITSEDLDNFIQDYLKHAA